MAGYRAKYTRLVARTAKMTPTKLASEFMAFRDWYDDPVTPAQAARELGIPLPVLRHALSIDLKKVEYATGKTTPILGLARLKQLAAGKSIPREVWEKGVYRDAHLIYLLLKKGGVI